MAANELVENGFGAFEGADAILATSSAEGNGDLVGTLKLFVGGVSGQQRGQRTFGIEFFGNLPVGLLDIAESIEPFEEVQEALTIVGAEFHRLTGEQLGQGDLALLGQELD